METRSSHIDDIVTQFLALDPYRMVLFGSQATGMQDQGSAIDLLVVLDSEAVSQTYEEKMRRKLMVRARVVEINKRVPIDLIVYTKAEYEILEKHGSAFLKEITTFGKTVYEKAS